MVIAPKRVQEGFFRRRAILLINNNAGCLLPGMSASLYVYLNSAGTDLLIIIRDMHHNYNVVSDT